MTGAGSAHAWICSWKDCDRSRKKMPVQGLVSPSFEYLTRVTPPYLSQFYNCCWLAIFTDIFLDFQHIMEHWSGERSISCGVKSEISSQVSIFSMVLLKTAPADQGFLKRGGAQIKDWLSCNLIMCCERNNKRKFCCMLLFFPILSCVKRKPTGQSRVWWLAKFGW